MLEILQAADVFFLHLFNQTLTAPWLDSFFALLTNLHKVFVVKALIFPALLIFWLYRYRWAGLKLILMIGLTVAVTDNLNYRLIKPTFNRTRPNLDPEVKSVLRLNFHPRGPSFPSNHAMNTFAVATVLVWVFGWRLWFFGFASLVAFSRLYLGVHYLSDITVGALLGVLISVLLIKWLFSRWCSLADFR